MAEYALLIDGQFKEIRQYSAKPVDIPHKQITWHDVVRRMSASEFTGLEDDNWIIQTVDPSMLPPAVPKYITPRQCRLVLYQQGLLGNVEAMIQQSTEDVRIAWEYASEFRRNDPLLAQFAANLGLTSKQLDDFFIAAHQL